MKLTCQASGCTRPRVRRRGGRWFCSWHPTSDPPTLDLVTGKIRTADEIAKGRKRARSHLSDPGAA